MKTIIAIIALLGISITYVTANNKKDERYKLFISQRISGDDKIIESEHMLNVSSDVENYFKTKRFVEIKKNGLFCEFHGMNIHSKGNITVDCWTKDNYRAQVEINCAHNSTKENSIYLFFGKVYTEKTSVNLNLWCRDAEVGESARDLSIKKIANLIDL